VVLPSVKEKVPALGTLAVMVSTESVCVKVELPPNDQVMLEGRGLAIAIQEMFTSSPSSTVTVVVLRASTLRGTGAIHDLWEQFEYTIKLTRWGY
jgi:hypothetical protein